jgi:hypothetical protein
LAATVLFLIRTYKLKSAFKRYRLFHNLTSISYILFVPFVVYKFADMIYYISVYILAFPFIPWFTNTMNYSIREFLGFLL